MLHIYLNGKCKKNYILFHNKTLEILIRLRKLPNKINQSNQFIMNKFNLKTALIFMLVMAVSFSSCQAIADIFKAGVWVGVLGVVVVVALIFWLISKAGKK